MLVMLFVCFDLRAWWLMHQALYNKDDFFDSLSCDAIEGGRAERTKFSEQRKIDTEVYLRDWLCNIDNEHLTSLGANPQMRPEFHIVCSCQLIECFFGKACPFVLSPPVV